MLLELPGTMHHQGASYRGGLLVASSRSVTRQLRMCVVIIVAYCSTPSCGNERTSPVIGNDDELEKDDNASLLASTTAARWLQQPVPL